MGNTYILSVLGYLSAVSNFTLPNRASGPPLWTRSFCGLHFSCRLPPSVCWVQVPQSLPESSPPRLQFSSSVPSRIWPCPRVVSRADHPVPGLKSNHSLPRLAQGVPPQFPTFCSRLSDLNGADPAKMLIRLTSLLEQLPLTQSKNPNPHNGVKDGCWPQATPLHLISWPCCVNQSRDTPLNGCCAYIFGSTFLQTAPSLSAFFPPYHHSNISYLWRCSLTSLLGHAASAYCFPYLLPLFSSFPLVFILLP